MHYLYLFISYIIPAGLWPSQFFSFKMKKFVKGRGKTFYKLKNNIKKEDKTIWFHCASLGEYEQGVPVMEALKNYLPNHKLVVTFFSPSGYDAKKNSTLAHLVCYLPYDTPKNAKKFIDNLNPSLAFFVKYDFWPFYLKALNKNKIPTFLISGVFRKNQLFFKWYGGYYKNLLKNFTHLFLQTNLSQKLLSTINITQTTVSGDTRFDRVVNQLKANNHLPFMEPFVGDNICMVCGSTWPEDIEVLLPFIHSKDANNCKIVMAPHQIEKEKIKPLLNQLMVTYTLYSQHSEETLKNSKILILDTIGLLSKVYSYADIAYVGGAMGKTGLHNILEPATFGIPVVIGKNYEKFPEAIILEDLAGLYTIQNKEELSNILNRLIKDESFRLQTGLIAGKFVDQQAGATQKVIDYLKQNSFI